MAFLPHIPLLLAFTLVPVGTSYRTPNFVVDAPTVAIAKQVGDAAEQYRRDKAKQWLGKEMPAWPERCPLKVTVTTGGTFGATTFTFDKGKMLCQAMQVEGSVERILANVVPHEVTHTVLAHRFRRPLARWADEGIAVLAEDPGAHKRQDKVLREVLASPDQIIPLRRLFAATEYPNDATGLRALYAEGHSVARFLVDAKDRATLLAFVDQGMRDGWDKACKTHYKYAGVDELEQAWLSHVKEQLAKATPENGNDRSTFSSARASVKDGEHRTPSEKGPARLVAGRPNWIGGATALEGWLEVDAADASLIASRSARRCCVSTSSPAWARRRGR
jgi:hypothetical protein